MPCEAMQRRGRMALLQAGDRAGVRYSRGRTSPFHTSAFIFTRSTSPLNESSSPMGSWMTSGLAPRLEMTWPRGSGRSG
jgi:hypothetical protein